MLIRKVFLCLLFHYPNLGVSLSDITVDFATRETSKSLSGFLGILSDTLPPRDKVMAVKPKWWRYDKPDKEISHQVGTQNILLLSNLWGYPVNGQTPPYSDLESYKQVVRDAARKYRYEVIYDIWNEPDIFIFWWTHFKIPGTNFNKFLEIFKVAHDIIREELGEKAIISGPSITFFNTRLLDRFMRFCKKHNLKVQILSWHLLYQTDAQLPLVQSKISAVRKMYIDNAQFRSVGVKEVHINEYLMAYRQNSRPGSVLAFLRHMELAGVDGACRASWAHPGECKNLLDCYLNVENWTTFDDGSMNGLLTHPEFAPRAIYWAYKFYADGADSRVRAQSNHPRIMVIGSARSGNEKAQVLLAYYGGALELTKNIASLKIELRNVTALSFLDDAQASISIRRIPYENGGTTVFPTEQALPLIEDDRIYPIDKTGNVQMTVHDVWPYDVIQIEIESATLEHSLVSSGVSVKEPDPRRIGVRVTRRDQTKAREAD